MGLDMNLSKKLFIKNYSYEGADQSVATLTHKGVEIDCSDATYIEFEVGYWRKANAIHNWFVENCQGGVDECQITYVSLEELQYLLDDCKKVMEVAQIDSGQPVQSGATYHGDGTVEHHITTGRAILNGSEVAQILPSRSGFFFGSTDYDEWYIRDIERTIEILEKVIAEDEEARENHIFYEYYYQSSW